MITEGGMKIESKKKKQRTLTVPAISFVGAFSDNIDTNYKPTDYKTPIQLERAIENYFNELLDPEGHMVAFPTITGLSLWLGFSNLKQLKRYEKKADEQYKYLLERAKLTCQYFYEIALTTRQSPTGAIFTLKSQFNWKEEPDVQINIQNNTTVIGQLAWDDPEEVKVVETKINDDSNQD